MSAEDLELLKRNGNYKKAEALQERKTGSESEELEEIEETEEPILNRLEEELIDSAEEQGFEVYTSAEAAKKSLISSYTDSVNLQDNR